MKISIDVDGVISVFDDAVNKIANTLLGKNLPEGYEPKDWYWTDVFAKDDWDRIWVAIKETNDFWVHQTPYVANLNALRKFLSRAENHDVYFITSRAQTAGRTVGLQTAQWLNNHMISAPYSHTAVIPVANPKEKYHMMAALGIEYSVDDLGPTVEACNKEVPNHKAFLLDRPWNRDKEYGQRIFSLQEFFEAIQPAREKA